MMNTDNIMNRVSKVTNTSWAFLLILGVAMGLRLLNISEWSLWEDEEGTIYYSQNTGKPFPNSFPIFFVALKGLFHFTGVSVGAGRLLTAFLGALSVWIIYFCFRRYVSRNVALLAALFLCLNLGHLFLSQSIRYYTLIFVFQLLSMYWFLDGFEKGSVLSLFLSNIAFLLALLSHFSAVLIAPVFVGYIAAVIAMRENEGGYNLKGYLCFGLPFIAIMGMFFFKIIQMQGMISGWVIPSGRNPLYILITVAAYFGLPVLGLGILAVFQDCKVIKRVKLFFIAAAVIPILELVVIGSINIVNVCWYYAFFSLIGFAILASLFLEALYVEERRIASVCFGGISVLYYMFFLFSYNGIMHGDRPRWEEATACFKIKSDLNSGLHENMDIYSTSPGVVKFYLGIDPGKTMNSPLVEYLPQDPPMEEPAMEQWYIVRAGHFVTQKYAQWFSKYCTLDAKFEAKTGPIDRSLLLYHYKSKSNKSKDSIK
jgi:hypothetical protein